jgi:hypothetical protein
MIHAWAIKFRSRNRIDGYHEHFMFKPHCTPIVFRTRDEARAYIRGNYGYIRNRPDLRAEPHGWLAPIPVKVRVVLDEIV